MTSRSIRNSPFMLLAVGIVGSFLLFVTIAANYVMQDSFVAFDLHIAQLLFASRAQLPLHFYYAVTVLMNATTVLCTGALLTFLLWRQHAAIYVFTLWLALTGSTSLMLLAKSFFQRSRPVNFLPIVSETSYSFPSGHATIAVILFGFLAYLFAREQRSWLTRFCIIGSAAVMIFLIDVSRLYLGVHYVSDVLAGNALGFTVLLASIAIGEWHLAHHTEKLPHIRKSVFLSVVLTQIACLLSFLFFTPLEF